MDSRQISVFIVVAFMLLISVVERGVKAQDVTSDMPSIATVTTKKPMMPMKLGDMCDMSEQCSKKMENSECKSNKCVCKSDYKEDGKKMNCMKGAGVQTFVSVSCLVLAMMVKLTV